MRGRYPRPLDEGSAEIWTAREALLSDRVARVEALELLPQVIDWHVKGLTPLLSGLIDERLTDWLFFARR